ncbi:hypothetical protein K439DRAFT_1613230 [Ramaria rubella]|nr:hypothetical protein K439DRAFT_1613230 [Ramaria rubella]
MSGGFFINPAGISKYNEHRRQAFECWCGLLSPDTPMFVELRKTAHGSYASCDECGLNFSLDEKFQTTSMTADFPAFDKHGPTMPASSPMAGLSAGGPPPQHIRLVSAGRGQGWGRGQGQGCKPVSWLGLGPRTPKQQPGWPHPARPLHLNCYEQSNTKSPKAHRVVLALAAQFTSSH